MSFDADISNLDGLQLIEASAGTGKTWTIAALYARLVLERDLTPDQILVVTYTRAATAELRGRIRSRLASLARAFATGRANDSFEQTQLDQPPRESCERTAERLRLAVSAFDAAAVFTIHAFCQHALAEHALAAGVELGREFVGDETAMLEAAADMAWKAEVEAADSDWLRYLIERKQGPDAWAALLRGVMDRSNLHIELPAQGDTVQAAAAFTDAFTATARAWHAERAAARAWLDTQIEAKTLSGSSHRRAWVDTSLAFWDTWLSGPASPALPGKPSESTVARLCADSLRGALKGGATVPTVFEHFAPLVDKARALAAAYEARLAALHGRLVETLRAHVHAQKVERGVMSYHDLLVELDAALAADGGAVLARALQQRYRAALIDEFQDTDPLQFRIFERVFGHGAVPCFLVGDPKQAIYAFRGAELHAYLAARERVPAESRHTLRTNWRSTPALVGAVERLFQRSTQPFVIEGLDFPHVDALAGKPALLVDGQSVAALQWRWLGEGLGKMEARHRAVDATADCIAHYLQPGRTMLGERPLAGGDVAVLASSHAELEAMHAALAVRGVASVRLSRESVFHTPEASDLLQVLTALAEPSDTRLRNALLTVSMALNAGEIAAALDDEAGWDAWWLQFHGWHELFAAKGAMAALSAWLTDSGTALRLAALQDGERRLTNLLHLFELIELAQQERAGVGPLLSWYRQELTAAATGEDDARIMRLESDAARVRLITIHASKGLEFPVVFCPFLWDGQLMRQGELTLCYEQGRPVLDLGSPQQPARAAAAEQERLAEKLRLLYVALTRPISACILAWGDVKDVESSALGWLLAGGDRRKRDGTALRGEIDTLMAAQPAGAMAWLAPEAASELPAATQPNIPPIQVATLDRKLAWRWRMSSFSALTAGLHDERPDHDLQLPVATEPASTGRFDAFPAGPRAGVCLHSLFETWDFASTDRMALEALSRKLLEEHGFDANWTTMAADMVEATLDAPLIDGLRLRGLAPAAKLVELEFTYTLQPFGWPALIAILADPRHGVPPAFAQAARQLTSQAAAGYLKGYIDLTCELGGRHYVLDWKSNRLDRFDDAALEAEMAAEHYYLQALIYCVALHRFLRWRHADYDFERDFGGAIYLFLRGMDADAPGSGVWHHRPSLGLIKALEALLCGDKP
ncbi:MAG: exodeoxyribonuclease V subunit beta [Burkholderiales bacterium]|nr:exodeoxyribonuclease V subunit beta [Burkholderiales bacterium]